MKLLEGVSHDPEAALARYILRFRRKREELLGQRYFADPVWDIMLDLFAAQAVGNVVPVSSVLIGAAVPTSTALRRIRDLLVDGVLIAIPDPKDGRRTFLRLAPDHFEMIGQWLRAFGRDFPAIL